MKVALIFARGGSRRIPRKNVKPFRGIPMLLRAIHTAQASKLFDMVIVSTDDDEIADTAFIGGAVVVPRARDDGTTGTQELAGRLLDQLELTGSIAAVIYPCVPLLTPELLREGYQMLLSPNLSKCFVRAVGPDGKDCGSHYFGWIRAFRDRKPLDAFNTTDHVLPAERAIDIDTMEDWKRAEEMFDATR